MANALRWYEKVLRCVPKEADELRKLIEGARGSKSRALGLFEAYLEHLSEHYNEFLRNNPKLEDPLRREKYKKLAVQILQDSSNKARSSRKVRSERVTDAAVSRMLAESDRIRTGFRGEAEHDSGMIPNSIPG